MSVPPLASIAEQVVAWQACHGRNHLPWQQTRDPYRVWLSEIMLQQTQVATVLDYYHRFLKRFPDVAALAHASQDEVMGLWSGLGYYTRARNLHRCALQVVTQYGGEFPRTAEQLARLPGIGRSTAGAIAAFCFSERVPILDANVRRVLTRVLGFGEDLASTRSEGLLWDAAQAQLPDANHASSMPRYTQGLMDLGASVCTPRAPDCAKCPLVSRCVAFQQGNPERYPVKTRKLVRRTESWHLLILRDLAERTWLERRPSTGIWAGMHCVPVFSDAASMDAFLAALGSGSDFSCRTLQPFLHVLTHRDLHLHPHVVTASLFAQPGEHGAWYGGADWPSLGLPAPVRKLLGSTQSQLW